MSDPRQLPAVAEGEAPGGTGGFDNAGAIRIEGQICEGQVLSPARGEQGSETEQSGEGRNAREVRVTVIRGGASSNGYYYNEAVLRAIAGLLNSAQAYV
ncbi:MAG TPA: hypothetical protein VFQ30_18205, partial [Ktedonobacteraceae bacterium]|nr:hypothetical protein [Ktedonobacteraceae bacterium]